MFPAFSRRRFLQNFGGSLAAVSLAGQWTACTSAPASGAKPAVLAATEMAVVNAAAHALIAPAGKIPVPPEEVKLAERIDAFLGARDAIVAAQFRRMLLGIEYYPRWLTRYFTAFTQMQIDVRREFLVDLETSETYLKRTVFTALKTVICNHYFAHPKVQAELGYAPVCRW